MAAHLISLSAHYHAAAVRKEMAVPWLLSILRRLSARAVAVRYEVQPGGCSSKFFVDSSHAVAARHEHRSRGLVRISLSFAAELSHTEMSTTAAGLRSGQCDSRPNLKSEYITEIALGALASTSDARHPF